MEEKLFATMKKVIKIVLTGPECTGKSTLTKQLAGFYNADYFSEYARDYIQNIERPYTFEDVEHIAKVQLNQVNQVSHGSKKVVFFDTFLIITKVWFDVVYGSCPSWIEDELKKNYIDLFLLCDIDIPWIADDVRENGGENRQVLFLKYKNELEKFGFNYITISGLGESRLLNAINAVNDFFPDIYSNKQ